MIPIWLYWLVLSILFLIIEILTPGIFLFSCLSIGALLALITAFLTKSLVVQIAVFVICSLLSIYFLKPFLTKVTEKLPKSNVDKYIGKKALVVEPINGYKTAGLVKIEGELWRAVSVDKEKILQDEEVEIVKVDGTHLVVKKLSNLKNY